MKCIARAALSAALICGFSGVAHAQTRAQGTQGSARIDVSQSISNILDNVITTGVGNYGTHDSGEINKGVTNHIIIWEDLPSGGSTPKPSDPAAITDWLKSAAAQPGGAARSQITQMSDSEFQQYLQYRADQFNARADTEEINDSLTQVHAEYQKVITLTDGGPDGLGVGENLTILTNDMMILGPEYKDATINESFDGSQPDDLILVLPDGVTGLPDDVAAADLEPADDEPSDSLCSG